MSRIFFYRIHHSDIEMLNNETVYAEEVHERFKTAIIDHRKKAALLTSDQLTVDAHASSEACLHPRVSRLQVEEQVCQMRLRK